MILAAAHQFELDIPDKRGHRLREAIVKELERISERQAKGIARPQDPENEEKMRHDLAGPAFPVEVFYVYRWFCSLCAGRTSNGFGPNALAATEIYAWSQLTGNYVSPWDFDLIRQLDSKWLEIYGELHKPDPPKENPGR